MAEQKFLTNLDVAGTIDLNNLTINSAQGTDGQVLTSTGSGIAWEDASGGASLSGGAANKLAIWSGTDALTNDTNLHWDTTNDRLGIGTASPGGKLHAATPDPATNFVAIDFRNPSYGIYAKSNSISARGNTLEFTATDYNNGGTVLTTDLLTLRPEGNVGIGTTTPSTKLHVNGRAVIGENNTIGSSYVTHTNIIGRNNNTANTGVTTGTSVILGDGDGGRYGNVVISERTLKLGTDDNVANSSSNSTAIIDINNNWRAGSAYSNIRGFLGYFTPPTTSNDIYWFYANDNNSLTDSSFGAGNAPEAAIMQISFSPNFGTNSAGNSSNTTSMYFAGNASSSGAVYITASNQNTSSRGVVTIDGRYQNQNYEIPDGQKIFEVTSGWGRTKFVVESGGQNNEASIGIQKDIFHLGDTNTFFGFTGADTFGITTGGTERLSIGNSGATFSGSVTGSSFVKSGGTSSQFLKADGSVDSNTYLTAHPNISAASSSDNSGRTYIQDITLDSNGHVTGIATATESVTAPTNYLTDNAFDSGIGLYLQGGSFNAGTDTATTPLVIDEEDFILTKDGGYLRRLIGKTSDQIQIGQGGTGLISSINFIPGNAGNSAVKINNNTIWNAGNDGSGSGLDADLLDGQHGSYYALKDHFRHTGTGYYTSTTTSALLSEALGDDAFDSGLSAHKTGWSYAGNGNLTDAGRLTELAGTSWLWWTDNFNDNVQGNVTALCIAPTTGGSAGKMFVYNNQGSSYSPGWREVWTSTSDGSGSGLDADLLDGNHASAFATSSHTHAASDVTSGTFATARIPNLAASKITSGTFSAARIAHNSFDIGDTTAETGRSVHETGIYTFNRNNGTLGTGTDSSYYSVLAFGQGTGGSVQIAGQWTSGGNKLYWRSLRDTTDNWWDWKEIYHTTHKPTPSEIGAVAKTGDTMTGALTIDTTTHATLSLDRASTSYDNNLIFRTAGSIKWRLWQDGSDDYLYVRNESSTNNVMTWRNNNTVGINTGTPNATLHLQVPAAAAPSIFLQASTNFAPGIYFDDSNTGTSAAGAIIYANANNTFSIKANSSSVVTISSGTTTIAATADIVAYSSDKRLKENVQPIEKPLNKVLKLEGVTYNWNKKAEDVAGFDTKIKEVGLFAQDVQKVLPEAVKLAPFDTDEDFKSKSGKDYLTVQYEKIVPLLVEAIKDQQKQIDELKSIINGGS